MVAVPYNAGFRAVKADDLSFVCEMQKAFYAHFGYVYQAIQAQRNWTYLLEHAAAGEAVLICRGIEPCGYMLLSVMFSLELGGFVGILDELFLQPTARSFGFGTAAVNFAKIRCKARGWQALRLEVEEQNPRAQSLYNRLGFKRDQRQILTCRDLS